MDGGVAWTVGKGRSKTVFPEERSSTRHLIPLEDVHGGGLRDESFPDPEEALLEKEGYSGTSEASEAQEDPVPCQDGVFPYRIEDVERWAHRLPPREVDFLRLRLQGLTQEAIAEVFGVTQAAVSYRLSQGVRRIRWLSTVPELDPDRLDLDLVRLSLEDRLVLRALYLTTCQTASVPLLEEWTSRRWTQGRVRYVMLRAWRRLREFRASEPSERASLAGRLLPPSPTPEDAERARLASEQAYPPGRYEPYFSFFSSLIGDRRWNVLHEVSIPTFARISDAVIMSMDDED